MRIKLRANWVYKAEKTNQPAERKPVRTFTARRHYTTVLECFFPHKKKTIHLNELKVQQQENLWLTKCQ